MATIKDYCKAIIDDNGMLLVTDIEGKVLPGQVSTFLSQDKDDASVGIARITVELIVSLKK